MGFSITSNIQGKAMTAKNSTAYYKSAQERFEIFKSKAKKVHGDFYDYSLSEYIDAQSRIEIKCPNHGFFLQRPADHLSGKGCRACANERISKSKMMSNEQFILKSKSVHGGKYGYSKTIFKGTKEHVLIECMVHGFFSQPAGSHLAGRGCTKCKIKRIADKNRFNNDDFLRIATKKHNNKYDYSLVVYAGYDEKVKIICKDHGVFLQRAGSHLKGAGCWNCYLESRLNSGWSRTGYINKTSVNANGFSELYLIRCFNDSESFYKIGITCAGVENRFKAKRDMPYKYEVLRLVSGESGFIWDLEFKIHSILKDYAYSPLIRFKGETECFSEITKPVHKLLKELSITEQLQLIA